MLDMVKVVMFDMLVLTACKYEQLIVYSTSGSKFAIEIISIFENCWEKFTVSLLIRPVFVEFEVNRHVKKIFG
jgi:hypothetical protein